MSKELALSNLKSGLPIPPEIQKLGFAALLEVIKFAFQSRGMLRQRVTVLEGIVEAQAELNAKQETVINLLLEREGKFEVEIATMKGNIAALINRD